MIIGKKASEILPTTIVCLTTKILKARFIICYFYDEMTSLNVQILIRIHPLALLTLNY